MYRIIYSNLITSIKINSFPVTNYYNGNNKKERSKHTVSSKVTILSCCKIWFDILDLQNDILYINAHKHTCIYTCTPQTYICHYTCSNEEAFLQDFLVIRKIWRYVSSSEDHITGRGCRIGPSHCHRVVVE